MSATAAAIAAKHRPETERAPAPTGALSERFIDRAYLSCEEMLENVVFNLVPRPLTTAMIATEMPAAIRPYSMAVAPDSSFKKRETRVFIRWLLQVRNYCLR